MVDIDIINGTIAEWEAKDLTFLVVERLAWLYIVRDNAMMHIKEDVKSEEPIIMPHVAISSGSEFMEACEKADHVKMWQILDEMMDAVRMLNPKLYQATIDKLREE